MIVLNLTQHRKARVWLAEFPEARVEFEAASERVVETDAMPLDEVRRAGVEILIPRGPRALYGLLGAELRPNRIGELRVRVLTCSGNRRRFKDAIALASDEVYVGLPDEFAAAVIEGVVEQNKRPGGLASGELVFQCAAHGLVGSSPTIFKWLSAVLVRILNLSAENLGEPKLAELLREPL